MALERVDSFADIPALEAEKKQLIGILKESQDALSQLNGKAIKIEIELGNIKTVSELTKALSELGNISKETADALKLQSEAQKNLAQATLAEKQAVTEDIKAKRDALKLSQDLEKQTAREEKRANALTGEYAKLSKELNLLRNQAKDYIVGLKEMDATGLQMVANVQALDTRLKQVDATLGQHQRNVGNYNAVGAQFNQLLREAPNFAISLRTGLMALSNNFTYFAESVQQSIKAGGTWRTVIKDIGGSLFGFTGLINIAILAVGVFGQKLFESGNQADKTASEIDKITDAIDKLMKADAEYQESGDRTGNTKQLQREINLAKARGDNAKDVYDLEKGLLVKKEADIKREIEAYGKLQSFVIDSEHKTAREVETLAQSLPSFIRDQLVTETKKAAEAGIDITASIVKRQGELEQDLADAQNAIKVKEAEFNKTANDKAQKEEEKRAKEKEARIKTELDNQSKILTAKVTHEALIEKSLADDESSTFAARIVARQRLADDQIQIIKIQRDKELANDKLTSSGRLAIELEANNKILQVKLELLKDIDNINQKELDEIKKKEKERVKAVADADKEIHDRRVAYFDARLKEYNEEQAKFKQQVQSIQQIATAIVSLGQIRKNQSAANLSNIDEDLRKTKENYDYQVDLIRQSVDTEEEKERRIQEAQAKTRSQEAQLREEARQERVKQAEFDKALAIAQIVINTASAVVLALKDPKAPLIKAIAVGAAGAAQLAIAAATPIPQFAEGDTEGKKTGGIALIGEREPELVIEPTGRAYMVNQPTVTDLMPKTKIFNQSQINDLFAGLNAPMLRNVLRTGENARDISRELSETFKQGNKDVVNAIKGNRAIQNVNVYGNDMYYQKMVKGKS